MRVKSGGQSKVITQRIESFVPRDRLELSHAAIYRLEGLVGLAGRLSGYTERAGVMILKNSSQAGS
ncbi:MAG: hypothetical protein AAF735_07010 [Myxococcota bacterium]